MPGESIESIARRLSESLPQGLKDVRDDAEKNFRAVLKSGIERLDLVSREEFDVQAAVLQKTRDKLEVLEQRLTDLEANPPPSSGSEEPAASESE